MRGRRGDGGIRAVLFDVGGTLIDERDPVRWAECAHAAGIEVDPEALSHCFDEAEKENDSSGNRIDFEAFWKTVLERAAGTTVPLDRVRVFAERGLEGGPPASLYTDVRWCLDQLRRRRLALGVVSNSRSQEHIEKLLARAGILSYFSTVVSSGTEGVAKPDPEIFRRALQRLNVPAEAAFYVGNLPNVDARAARAAGLHAVWLNRGGTGFGEDPPEITSLTELPLAVRDAARLR
ncbi:MAG TPA: HAD-IA family hydrolase [Thermoplasmata archaeon]|nr:HAD-IA family hydrolase [Thermoplasmata archaeon]